VARSGRVGGDLVWMVRIEEQLGGLHRQLSPQSQFVCLAAAARAGFHGWIVRADKPLGKMIQKTLSEAERRSVGCFRYALKAVGIEREFQEEDRGKRTHFCR
jgi:hypothetical protein